MRVSCVHGSLLALAAGAVLVAGLRLPEAESACCYFAAKDKDILQPAQKVFITWNPAENVESFTVQPKFEGNADDFGMVIPTPSKPKLDEMPRDFFKELALYTLLKKREQPQSKLLPVPLEKAANQKGQGKDKDAATGHGAFRPPAVKVLEAGVVGNLDYKIIEAGRADDLFGWLKDNKYTFPVLPAGDYVHNLVPELSIPRNWIVDRDGVLRMEKIGFGMGDDQWVNDMIGEMEKARPAR